METYCSFQFAFQHEAYLHVFRNKTLIVAIKNYPKADMKVFLSCPNILDLYTLLKIFCLGLFQLKKIVAFNLFQSPSNFNVTKIFLKHRSSRRRYSERKVVLFEVQQRSEKIKIYVNFILTKRLDTPGTVQFNIPSRVNIP